MVSPETGKKLASRFLFFLLLLSSASGYAITASVSPSPSYTGTPITLTVTFKVLSPTSQVLQVDYGDGGGWQNVANIPGNILPSPPLLTGTFTHTYTTPGTYTIRVRSASGTGLTLPNPVSTTTTVLFRRPLIIPKPEIVPGSSPSSLSMNELPPAILGLEYSVQLEIPGTRVRENRFTITRGKLPRKIRMDRYGKISGVPEVLGRYPFTVQATLKDGSTLSQDFTLVVGKSRLSVKVTPNPVRVDRNRSGTYTLTYLFTAADPLDDELLSTQGTFWAGNRQIGVSSRRLTGTLKQGRGEIRERMTVPLSVVKTVQRLGLREILYKRTFTSRYLEAKTVSMATIVVGTGFSISRMHIYFDDDRAKMMVKRNQRDLSASVDITYDGAGLLKGYWQVDNRILARVQKQLPHGRNRVVTFTYPGHPPLPTYFTGSHRLRFVVTEPPPPSDAFPFVIYVVSGDSLADRNPVRIVFPGPKQRISLPGTPFRWKPARLTEVYLLSFYEEDGREPFFTAYARGSEYRLKDEVVEKFQPGHTYAWQIRGYDTEGQVVALSRRVIFRVAPADHRSGNGEEGEAKTDDQPSR